jgi:hypothetical protein
MTGNKGEKHMADEKQNPLFTYVETRIAAWQAVLASLKAALSLDPSGKAGEGIDLSSIATSQGGDMGQPIDLPDGAFFGKSVPACVKLYLSAARKKKTAREIATALRDGGVESTSGNFENIVTTALVRLRKAGEVLKFKDGWGLAEWYPANMRTSGVAGKPSEKSKRKNKKLKPQRSSPVATTPTKVEAKKVTQIRAPEDKPETRILAFFKANSREIAASEVATALGLKIQTTHLILAKLAHQKKIQKLAPGQFKGLGVAS